VKRRLPIRLHLKHGAYYYVTRIAGKVCWRRLSTEYGEALRMWADLEGGKPNHAWTVADAIAHYIGVSAKRLKPATLLGYEENAKRLLPVFGAMPIADLRRAHVYSYVVKRGNVAGNRERALLSAVFAHLGKAGIFEGPNPAAGLQFRNPEKPRRRYATDGERGDPRGVQSAYARAGAVRVPDRHAAGRRARVEADGRDRRRNRLLRQQDGTRPPD
jgi:hypothetical protein